MSDIGTDYEHVWPRVRFTAQDEIFMRAVERGQTGVQPS